MRTSSYTIYVPLPDNRDEMLLVHGYTGAYDRVSRSIADFLLNLEATRPEKPLYGEWVSDPSALSEREAAVTPDDGVLEVLKKRGYLTTMTVDEESGYLARTVKKMHQIAARRAPQYIFMPTYNCNLRCSYCFQDHMRSDPNYKHLLRTIKPEVVDRIFAAMPVLEEPHGIRPGMEVTRNIGFFGGEPLLAENRPMIEYIMVKARSMGPARFWAVSNATELEAYEDILEPEGISEIQITMDGPPDEHDKRRIYADGSGSFQRIAHNLDLCLDRGVAVSLRMNIDRMNVDQLPALADTIVDRGWHERPGFSAYTAPITNAEQSITLTQLQSRYFSSWELDQAIDELRARYPNMRVIGRPDDGLIGRVRRMFDQRSNMPDLKTSFCGAHTSMYIFDSFGDMYACWERTGDEKVRIGRVLEGGQLEMNEGLTRMWRTRTPASNPTCRKCRYAMHCGGGCAVLAEGRNGKIHSNYCDGFGDRFRASVAEAYTSFVRGDAVTIQERVCDL
ncbi:MAG TPA: SPASM domain-containing protein [Longimicrobium sp.]